jgi:hypothetical protein
MTYEDAQNIKTGMERVQLMFVRSNLIIHKKRDQTSCSPIISIIYVH